MPPVIQKHLAKAFPYPPGRPIEEIQRRYGLRHVVKLASNENPLGPSPKAVAAMKKFARQSHLYPDGNAYYLREALARKHGVQPEQIVFGSGSDELNVMIATAYVGPGRNLVASEGSFIRYAQCAIVSGGEVKAVPFTNWRHDVDSLLRAIDANTGALCIANPENPAGTMVTKAEADRLVAGTPNSVFLLLDEAYYEYAMANPYYPDSMAYLKTHDNVMVTRTFSKAYGLAGLRVGYGIATADIAETFDRIRPPFNVTRIAQEAALAALDDEAHLKRAVEVNEVGKAYYEKQFAAMGLESITTYTNFVTVNVRRNGEDVFKSLLPRGVIVRPLGGYGMPTWLRISIGLPRENRKCIQALRAVLPEISVVLED